MDPLSTHYLGTPSSLCVMGLVFMRMPSESRAWSGEGERAGPLGLLGLLGLWGESSSR